MTTNGAKRQLRNLRLARYFTNRMKTISLPIKRDRMMTKEVIRPRARAPVSAGTCFAAEQALMRVLIRRPACSCRAVPLGRLFERFDGLVNALGDLLLTVGRLHLPAAGIAHVKGVHRGALFRGDF